MKEELSLKSPYKIFYEEGEYYFFTSSGIKYILYFKDVSYFGISYLDQNILEFGFKPEYERGRNDKNIRLTVFSFIEHYFLKNKNNVLFFITDSLDNKQKARKRLFDKWINESKNIKLLKYDINLKTEDMVYYGSLILSENNIYRQEYEQRINETLEIFKNGK